MSDKTWIRVLSFQEPDGRSPVVVWLDDLRRTDPGAFEKGVAMIRRPQQSGHALRRPTAATLRDGIHELRWREGRVNDRLLYFFHGRGVAVLAHGLMKEADVPRFDVERALTRKRAFEADPERHTTRG
jgi:phage-related protein